MHKDARAEVAEGRWDPIDGAWPHKHVARREVVDRGGRAVLEGRFTKGDVV